MHLKELASQTDPLAFQRLYHDPTVHTSEIATRYGILPNRVSEFAHLLGVPTRRALGLKYTPPLLRGRKPTARKPGQHGCNPDCVEWRRCRAGRLWVDGPLPCETLLKWEIENEFEDDSSPSLWTIPLTARVNMEAMG